MRECRECVCMRDTNAYTHTSFTRTCASRATNTSCAAAGSDALLRALQVCVAKTSSSFTILVVISHLYIYVIYIYFFIYKIFIHKFFYITIIYIMTLLNKFKHEQN